MHRLNMCMSLSWQSEKDGSVIVMAGGVVSLWCLHVPTHYMISFALDVRGKTGPTHRNANGQLHEVFEA